jgi:predicted dehydrogenase
LAQLVADSDVQVVHNTAPNVLHFEINKAVIAARKHLLAEKPLGIDPHETHAMLRAARAARIVHGVCFNYRMYAMTQEMRARIAGDALGAPRLIHGRYLQDWLMFDADYNWRVDAARNGPSQAIGDIGSHWCDLAQFVSGLRITAVCADLHAFVTARKRPVDEIETFAGSTDGKTGVDARQRRGLWRCCSNSRRRARRLHHLAGQRRAQERPCPGGQRRDCQPSLATGTARDALARHAGCTERHLVQTAEPADRDSAQFAGYPGGHVEGYPDGFRT